MIIIIIIIIIITGITGLIIVYIERFVAKLVLVITCLGRRFGSAFLKILCNFKIFINQEDDLSPKSPEPNKWLLVNHTKPKFVLKLIFF